MFIFCKLMLDRNAKQNLRGMCIFSAIVIGSPGPIEKTKSYIESFSRTLRKECLGWCKYGVNELSVCTDMVESFLMRYHYHRPYMSLMMRPPLLNFNGG